jgi:phosphoglycolate phosphatase
MRGAFSFMHRPLLICDLDGTLVDSESGVIEALRRACFAAGIEPCVPLDSLVIGPPLDEILRRVTGVGTGKTLHRLRNTFTEIYDGETCHLAVPFIGVEDMLQSLLTRGVRLALATNKREKPTSSILAFLGWRNLFDIVEAVDSRQPAPRRKAQMLRDILDATFMPKAAYLGDTVADIEAAREASLTCILAGWGYGGQKPESTTPFVHSPLDVLATFAKVVDMPRPDI